MLFFFNDTASTEIYTLSLHDALPISWAALQNANYLYTANGADYLSPMYSPLLMTQAPSWWPAFMPFSAAMLILWRSEEHTSELQSQFHLVCRLLLEKKKNPSSRNSRS